MVENAENDFTIGQPREYNDPIGDNTKVVGKPCLYFLEQIIHVKVTVPINGDVKSPDHKL